MPLPEAITESEWQQCLEDMPLIAYTIRRYALPSEDIDDLIHEVGIHAAVLARRTFDPSKGHDGNMPFIKWFQMKLKTYLWYTRRNAWMRYKKALPEGFDAAGGEPVSNRLDDGDECNILLRSAANPSVTLLHCVNGVNFNSLAKDLKLTSEAVRVRVKQDLSAMREAAEIRGWVHLTGT